MATPSPSPAQAMHESLGRLVEAVGAERWPSEPAGERRVALALALAQELELETHAVLSEMNETFVLLATMVEILWRCALDYDLRGGAPPDFFAYPSVHPYAESDPASKLAMRLENKEYQSSRFRRLHLELAKRSDGLEVFRVVMFPRVRFDLPIVALDMVGFGGRVSFAIVDATPVRRKNGEKKLPDIYLQAMTELRRKHFGGGDGGGGGEAVEMAPLPEWAERLFSEGCVCLRPRPGSQDASAFVGYCAELINFHMEASTCFHPLAEEADISEVYQGHQTYAREQLSNDKTRKALEASFGAPFAEAYMKQTLFDVEPGLYTQPPGTGTGIGSPASVGNPAPEARRNDDNDDDEEEEFISMHGATYRVQTGPLARIEGLQGNHLFVPKGQWTPGEEIAMLRLLNGATSSAAHN